MDEGRALRGDVHHLPWPLHTAEVDNTMAAMVGVDGPPSHVLFSPGVDTVVWTLTPQEG